MEFSNNQQTKYYALQILESVIKTRWKVLPRNQCEGIKKYIVGLIIKTSSDQQLMEKEKTYLNKLNMILVQVRVAFLTFPHICLFAISVVAKVCSGIFHFGRTNMHMLRECCKVVHLKVYPVQLTFI